VSETPHKALERLARSVMECHVRAYLLDRGPNDRPPPPGWEELLALTRHGPWLVVAGEMLRAGWSGPATLEVEKAGHPGSHEDAAVDDFGSLYEAGEETQEVES
jgi:hypothetical protein